MGLRKAGDYSKVFATIVDENVLDNLCMSEFQKLQIPIDKVCDFKIKSPLLLRKSMTIYVIDDSVSFGKWWRIRKVKVERSILLTRRNFRKILGPLKDQKEKFSAIGSREKGWFIQY